MMASKKENRMPEKLSPMQQSLCMDDKLKNLSCPFTWGMEDVVKTRTKLLPSNEDRFDLVVDMQDYFPEDVLVYHLMLAYENVMNNDLPNAMDRIEKAEETLDDIKTKASLKGVKNVLQHIFLGTKYHVLPKGEDANECLEGICNVDDMTKTELAMLNGCKCLGWMLYEATDNLQAIKCAQRAIEYEPSNGNWYFLLGKNYRRLRRKHDSISQLPNPQEASAFEEAFKLSENVLFGVSLAQMYRESRNYTMANQIYKKVYDLEPTCCKVRLQLALGFIRAKQCMLAKNCLDYVAERMPNANIYTHYMGIYEEKCNRDFEAALPYYKSTTENTNFVAEWQYVDCRKKVEHDWDPLPYLLDLLNKYDKDSNHTMQGINIQIGAYYLFELHDVLSACPYLVKAIEISPNATLLKNHFRLFRNADRVNIYHALTKEVQFALQNAARYDEKQIAVLEDTLQLCCKNCKDLPSSSAFSRRQAQSSQIPSSYSNYDKGFSPQRETCWRKEKPRSSYPGFSKNDPSRYSSNERNLPNKNFGSYRERDYTSWRSNEQPSNSSQSKNYSSRGFQERKDSGSVDQVRDRGVRRNASSNPRDKNDGNERNASCVLVKNLKDLNL